MESQSTLSQKSKQQSSEVEGGTYGEHPLQASAMADGPPAMSASPPPFNDGGGEEGSSSTMQLNADPQAGDMEEVDFGEPVDPQAEYQRGLAITGDGTGEGGGGGESGGNGGGNSGSSNSGGNPPPPADDASGGAKNNENTAVEVKGRVIEPLPAKSTKNGAVAGETGATADGGGVTATNLSELVTSLVSLPITTLALEIGKIGTQFNVVRDAEREVAKGQYPSTLQPLGLDPAKGDTAMVGSADPTVAGVTTPDVPDSTALTYHFNPPTNEPGSSLVSMEDGDGNVDLSAGARDYVDMLGEDVGVARLMLDLPAKRAEVVPDYDTAQLETKTNFGEGGVFPTVEGEAETLLGNAEFTEAEAVNIELGDPLPELGMGTAEEISAILTGDMQGVIDAELAKEAEGRTAYDDGIALELGGFDTLVDAEVVLASTDQKAKKTTATEAIAVFKQEWADENDVNLSDFDTDGLAERDKVDASITTELGRANDEIDTAYTTAEGKAVTEHERLKKENEDKKPSGGGFWGWLKRAWNSFKDWVKGAWNGFKSFVSGLWDGIKSTVSTIISAARTTIKGFVDGLKAALDLVVTRIKTAFTTIKDKFVGFIEAAIDTLKTELSALVDTLKTAVQTVLDTVSEAIVYLVENFESIVIDVLETVGQAILDMLLAGGEAALRLLLKMIGVSNADAVIDELIHFAGLIGDILKDPIGFAGNLIEVVVSTFTNYFQNIGDNLSEILTTWFFGNPDLELPSDFSADSWLKFALDVAEVDMDSMGAMLGADIELPGGISLDLAAPIEALVTDGPSGLWENLKGQLDAFPFVEMDSAEPAAEGAVPAIDGVETESVTNEDVTSDVSQMSWEGFLAEAEQFLPAGSVENLENASYIYYQFVSGEIPELINDLKEQMGDEFSDIPGMMMSMVVEWVKTDLLMQLPVLVASFTTPAGGIAKAIKAVYDGIMWCIDNKDQIWEVVKSVYQVLPNIVNGNLGEAEVLLTGGINQSIGLLLDLIVDVVLSSSPSKKLGAMVEKLGENVKNAFKGIMASIQKAIKGFMEAIQKMMGKRKKDKKRNTGDENEQETGEKDHRGELIPTETRIDNKIEDLWKRVKGKVPVKGSLGYTQVDYGSSYANRKKTYKVLQALSDLYTADNSMVEDGKITKEEALSLSARIRGRHKVFKTFTVIDSGDAKNGLSFNPKADKSYWVYEWVASDPQTANAGEKEESESESEAEFDWEPGESEGQGPAKKPKLDDEGQEMSPAEAAAHEAQQESENEDGTFANRLPSKPLAIGIINSKVNAKIEALTVGAGNMHYKWKAHQANINVGMEEEPQAARLMANKENMVRHLATVLLALDSGQVEVQVALSNSENVMYWANNKSSSKFSMKDQGLPGFIADIKSEIEDIPLTTERQERHWASLQTTDLANYGAYDVKKVATGKAEQHAETKIVDELKPENIEWIGGVKRPCVSCYMYMTLNGLSPSKFNPHHGSFWDTNAAALSYSESLWNSGKFKAEWNKSSNEKDDRTDIDKVATKIVNDLDWQSAGAALTNKFYLNEGAFNDKGNPKKSEALGYGTDSDNEDEVAYHSETEA